MKTSLLLPVLTFSFVTSIAQSNRPGSVTDNWFNTQSAAINQMQYKFSKGANTNQFKTNNPCQQLGFTFTPSGYSVHSTKAGKNEAGYWASFSMNGINSFGGATIIEETGKSSKLVYRYAGMEVEYYNDAKGMRQNFIVNKRPGSQKHLSVSMHINSNLTASVADGKKLVFSTANEPRNIQLIYDQLAVWDAKGVALKAGISYNASTHNVQISVEDKNAEYPVTIDPLNRTAEWTSSADGVLPSLLNNLQLQVQTNYGYTVSGLGDINGDGYDDVAVSAPTMADIISGTGSLTGVGAVFIYLGSSSGLSATPYKVLQPTTPVNGSLFGYSVSAGDVTGDGKNDIIIGAPLDSYQTTASSLLGPTSVTVKAGKVYVYRSEDLSGAGNVSPFLQIRLQGSTWFSTGILGVAASNVSVDPLFGFSVAVAKDLNSDGKDDIIVGAPAYMGVNLLSVKSGAAFIYYSNNLGTNTPAQLATPSSSLLGLPLLPLANTAGLLFGFSADGAGDYNSDGYPDVVVGAPAGINLNSLGGIFTGQFLGGSAYIYYGSSSGIQTTSSVRLQASASGLLSNAANLFGYTVKGAKDAAGLNTGNVLIGAPNAGILSNIVGGLQVKGGQLNVFKSKSPSASGAFVSDQVIASPRSSSILSILSGQTINVSLLFGASIDNMLDVNCDNIGDIIVGEPLSTAIPAIGANVVGGAAYIYLGKADGTYDPATYWDVYANVSSLLGVNATSLIGNSVAGAGYVKGHSQGVKALVGAPSNALDFGAGLLNLGNTMSVLNSFVFDNNGLGKAFLFGFGTCNAPLGVLPVKLTSFKGTATEQSVLLTWTAAIEENLNYYQLEKSTDALHFKTLAMVFTKEPQNDDYNFPDKHPVTGNNYYRLKMVDKDGQFIYSVTINVPFRQQYQAAVLVAPNPVLADINVRMSGLSNGNYRIQLYNSSGQSSLSKSVYISQPDQTEIIPRQNVAKGVYTVSIFDSANKLITSQQILVQ